VIALVAALALVPAPVPTPIGPGPAYRPAAGRPVPVCRTDGRFSVHVELFANRRAIVVPAGIGGCSDAARTQTPTGVVEVSRAGLVLGDLFRIWGRTLSPHRLLSFRSTAPVRAYVGGRPAARPAAAIPLERGTEIVVEIGGYVPPHRSFLFPKGSS
jgi:hypothetical protein